MLPLSVLPQHFCRQEDAYSGSKMVHCGENWSSRDIKCSVSLFNHLAEKQLHDLVTLIIFHSIHFFYARRSARSAISKIWGRA